MQSQDENRPPPSLDAKGDQGLTSSRNRPATLGPASAAPGATGCSTDSGVNRCRPPPLMGASMGNSETPASPSETRFPNESSPFSSSDAEDRFMQKMMEDQYARDTIEVCSRFFKRQSSFAPRDRSGARRRSKKRSSERMKNSPSFVSSSCGDSMHSASSRSRTATSSSQYSSGAAPSVPVTGGAAGNLSIALSVPVAEEGMSKSQERLMKFSQQIEALKNQPQLSQSLTRHTKQSSDTSAAISGWYGTNRATDRSVLPRGPKPIRAISDPSVNRVAALASISTSQAAAAAANHTRSQEPSSFSIPRVSTNESSSSTAAGAATTSRASAGVNGIGVNSVHPPNHPTAIPAFTYRGPNDLGDSLSRPPNQTDENKFQRFVRKLMKSKNGSVSAENRQRRRQKSDPVSHRYSTGVHSLQRNGQLSQLLPVEHHANAPHSQPNTAPGSTGTLSRRNSMSSKLLHRLNISQLFDKPGYEADSEHFQQQQEEARIKRLKKRSKLDSSREASFSTYDDAVNPDAHVAADQMKTSAKKQAGSKNHLAGPTLAHADSVPSTSKNSGAGGGGMFKKFKKSSSNILKSRRSNSHAPGDKMSITSSELGSLRGTGTGTGTLPSSTLDSLRSTSQFASHPASPSDRSTGASAYSANANVPFHFRVTPPPPSRRGPAELEVTVRGENFAESNHDTTDDVFNSNGQGPNSVRLPTAAPPLASLDSPFEDPTERADPNTNPFFPERQPCNESGPSSQQGAKCCPPKEAGNRRLSSTSESKFNWVVDRIIEIANENHDVVDKIVQNAGVQNLPDPAELVGRGMAPSEGSQDMSQNNEGTSLSQEGGAVGGMGFFPPSTLPGRKPSLPLCGTFSPSNVIMNQIRNSSTYEEFRSIFDLILEPLRHVVDSANNFYAGVGNSSQQTQPYAGPSTSSGARNDNNNNVSSVPGMLSTLLSVIYHIVGTADDPLSVPLASNLCLYIQEHFGRHLQDAGGYESLFSDHHTTDDNLD